MKKTLLCVVALLLSVTAIDAQVVTVGKKAPARIVSKKVAEVRSDIKKAPSASTRIQLEQDERIMGFYNTNDLDMEGTSSLGLSAAPGRYRVGGILQAGKFVGGQMTKVRFALAESVGNTNVAVYTVDLATGSLSQQPVASVDLTSTTSGWNDVTLDNPITIEANTGYLVTYDYQQNSTYNYTYMQYVADNYPVLVDYMVNPYGADPDGFLVYGDLGQGTGWYSMAGGYGNVCVQAVVKGGNIVDNDIALSTLTVSKPFYKNGDNVDFSLLIKSDGDVMPTSYTLNVAVDGNTVTTLNTPVTMTSLYQPVTGSFTLTGLEAGNHVLSVSVADIDGTKPTANVDDDVISANAKVYTTTLARQMNLVEQFTSTNCQFCPVGTNLLEEIQKLRDDVVIVAEHNYIMGNTDPFITDESNAYSVRYFSGGLPSAAFNRYYVTDSSINSDGTVGLGISFQGGTAVNPQMAKVFSESVIDASNDAIPTFATVDINTSYDETTRQLTVIVSGEALEKFNELVEDAILTVYLTEDGLLARQTGVSGNEVHNNVLRDVITETWGDNLIWTDVTHYSNTYTVTLDNSWDAENMHVVASIGRPVTDYSAVNDEWVNNANVAKVGGNSTGISGVVTPDENATEVARYALDGTQLSAPTKGINIIKMSDGTTRKVIVK